MKRIVLMMLSVVLVTGCYAQRESKKEKKGKKDQTEQVQAPAAEAQPAEENVVTEECVMNISLFNESAKNKQFADALEPWNKVFNECPSANRVIYSQGRNILHWEIEQQKDAASYQKAFDKLMKMFDLRMKYFGTDERYPTAWIKGIKALDYLVYSKSDNIQPPYEWLEEAIDGLGEKAEIEFLRNFVVLSDKKYAADKAHAEKYIADYLKVNALLDAMIADNSNATQASQAQQYKNGLDIVFAQSGAADCATLDNLYKDKVKVNNKDLDYLTKVISFYRRVRCTESEVYFSAAVDAYKIKPDAESAAALAAMSFSKDDFQQAIEFYRAAVDLTQNQAEKADYNYKIAQIYYSKLGDYPRTKQFAIRSLELNPSNGGAHLIIGLAYANARGIFDDSVLQKTVFWAAVDRFVRAKQVDPTLAEDADKLISTYSRHFPSKEDVFMHPALDSGKSFFVGGWISESTTAR
ncbi:MAG: hypothetical protein RBT57_13065 [Paludibacter sp.]|jgi:hypothetical protein|nr:hypothetical protein [Paludibacter sp.]